MRIFKYTGHAETTLKSRRIKVSFAHKLNDPFELSPKMEITSFTPRKAALLLRQRDQIDFWFLKEGLSSGFTDRKKYENWYLKKLPQRIDWLMERVPQNVEAARQRFAETFSRYWMLFCASKTKESILMWSHYARDHEGAVIEFETNEQPFVKLRDRFIVEVNYTSEKGNFDYDPSKPNKFTSSLIDIAGRKSPEWAYEQEVRVIFPRLKQDRELYPFEPAAIKSISFGCRSAQKEKDSIIELLESPDFSHVKIYQAKLNQDCFKLDLNRLVQQDCWIHPNDRRGVLQRLA